MSQTISDHHQIKTVSSFKELINREFQGDNNAICLQRNLVGDFEEIVSKLELKNNITEVSVEDLENLTLTDHGELAREIIINDLRLLADFGKEEDFDAFLKAYYFDLHYQPKADAHPINLGLGNLWRLSVDHPEQKVQPCVHRAPVENDGEYRLLLIC